MEYSKHIAMIILWSLGATISLIGIGLVENFTFELLGTIMFFAFTITFMLSSIITPLWGIYFQTKAQVLILERFYFLMTTTEGEDEDE